MQWIKIDSWHIIKTTWIQSGGTWWVSTLCGLKRPWDQTSLDSLPGGSEKSCENCLIVATGTPEEPKKPARRKK